MQAFRFRVPAWAILRHTFNFSINHHPKYKNTGSYFQTNKQKEMFNNFEIINYLSISLDYCSEFRCTYWFDGLLLLVMT